MDELINELHPAAPLDREFTRILRAILAELERDFARLQTGDLNAIHDLRKWLKRFRGFLRLYRNSLGARFDRLDTAARNIAQTLAGARELQAMNEALCLLAIDEHSLLKSAMARRLSKALGGRPGDEPLRGLIDIDLATAAFSKLSRAASRSHIDKAGFAAIGHGLAATYRRTRKALDVAQLSGAAEQFHTLRRHANYHRMHMRMIAPCWPDVMGARAEAGSLLHDALGEEHDLYELTRWSKAAALSADLRRDARLITILAAARRQRLQSQAIKIASQLFAEKPDRFVRRIEKYWTAAG